MKMLKKSLLCFLIFCLLPLSASDKDIFYIYFDEAYSLYQVGDYGSSEVLLHNGMEFWDEAADAVCLQALLDSRKPGKLQQAADIMFDLSKSGKLNRFEDEEILLQAGMWYYRLGQFEKAVTALSAIKHSEKKDENFYYVYFDSLLNGSGSKKAAQSASWLASRFTDSLRMQKLAISCDPQWAVQIAQRILGGTYQGQYESEVLQHLLDGKLDDSIRENLLIHAKKKGFKGASVLIADFQFGYPDRLALMKEYFALPLLNRQRCAFFYSLLADNEKKNWDEFFKDFSGQIYSDRDNDGYPELKTQWNKGLCTNLEIDDNQDQVKEQKISFINGIPVSIELNRDNEQYLLKYGYYPFLDTVTLMGSDRRTVYYLTDRMNKIDLPQGLFLPWMENKPVDWPLDETVLATVSDLREVYMNDKMVNLREYHQGLLAVEKYSFSGNGEIDCKVLYDNGQPYLGFRDLDWDGNFDITEIYENGKLFSLQYREQGQNVPEYIMNLIPQKAEGWDLNDDGILDLKVITDNNKTLRSFSTGLNGVFDVLLEEENGIIVKITRKGSVFTVTKAADGLLWIGMPGAMTNKVAETKFGTFVHKNKKYRVFVYNGQMYAEQLN